MQTKRKNNFPLSTLLERVVNTPLLVEQAPLDMVIAVLSGKIGATIVDELSGELNTDAWQGGIRATDEYTVLADGTAIVPIQGKLAHRHYGVEASSGIQSYSGALTMMDNGLADDKVKRIVFNMDTPGGEATGAFEAARQVFNARGKKPLIALVNESATSAGYLLAAACDTILLNNSGRVGSVGVIARVVDFSEAEKMEGLKSHVVFAGEGKNMLANSSVSKPELEWLQGKLNSTYDMFVKTVAEFRPALTEESLRKHGAKVFIGEEAVEAGFADSIVSVMDFLKSPSVAHTAIVSEQQQAANMQSGANQTQETKPMSTKLEQMLADALGFALTGDEAKDVELAQTAITGAKASTEKAVNEALSTANADFEQKLASVETRALKSEAELYVTQLEAKGKISHALRDKAIEKFMKDSNGFREYMDEFGANIPVGMDSKVNPASEKPLATEGEKAEKDAMRQQLKAQGYEDKAIEKAIAAAFDEE